MQEEIIKLCQELSIKKTCKNCAAPIMGGKCIWCNTKNPEIEYLLERLKSLLENVNITFDIFLNIFDIYELTNPKIIEYLKNSQASFILDIIEQNRKRFQDFIIDGMIKSKYKDVLKLAIKNNIDYLMEGKKVFHFFASEFFKGHLSNLDDESYLDFLTLFGKEAAKSIGVKSIDGKYIKIELISDKEMKETIMRLFPDENVESKFKYAGLNFQEENKIKFNSEVFLQTRFNDPFQAMITIYHELQHRIRRKSFYIPDKFSYIGLLIAKDELINRALNSISANYYYTLNYRLLPTEADADYMSYYYLTQLIHELKLDDELKDFIESLNEKMKIYNNFRTNKFRILNGEKLEVDELFERFAIPLINQIPSLMNYYRILKLQYKFDNGVFKGKTKEEILEAKSKTNSLEIELIYDAILDGLEAKEKA